MGQLADGEPENVEGGPVAETPRRLKPARYDRCIVIARPLPVAHP